jgi:hypothetical protein
LGSIPIFVIVPTAAQTAFSYYGGVLSDRLGVFKTLFAAFAFGIVSIFMTSVNLWLAFASLGLFTVMGLNAVSKACVFGVFYGGIALFGSLGAIVAGYLWKIYGFESLALFSEIGMFSMLVLLLLKRV